MISQLSILWTESYGAEFYGEEPYGAESYSTECYVSKPYSTECYLKKSHVDFLELFYHLC